MITVERLEYNDRSQALVAAVGERVLVLDGAMGTMIQHEGLTESDFRGDYRPDSKVALAGCNDLLCMTRPDVIAGIHRAYLDAGADIIETNSFNSNALSLADYGLADSVRILNLAAARLARSVADDYETAHPGSRRWVAGSVGPTSKSLSMSQGIDDPSADPVDWDVLVATYIDQMEALIEGGVDALLIETIFDGLNAKAAIYAARRAMERQGRRVPLMLSVTLTESGRTLSGQTLEAFVATVSHGEPLSIGLNCGFGADGMSAHVGALQRYPVAVSAYPNAGLPNEMGEYDETPSTMALKLTPMLEGGMLNIVGGCCGTTPAHIAAIAELARSVKPRPIPDVESVLTLAGLEAVEVSSDRNFMNVGERCNVAGSRKFLRLIKEGSIDEAVEIARGQVEAGAQVVDVNMDDAMLDAPRELASFISRIGVEPEVARVPLMIDSSNHEAILAGLKCVQGRPIVNSISLKEGEEKFVERARMIREFGAAMVVMAFDEQGQADTFERRIEVCGRAYKLLTERAGVAGEDIIFDPNVLAVATGIEAHDNYALDFIKATRWIKENLPGAKVSGGVSNLSFSFRGNNYVREAMHAVFLYHAIAAGMDMGIVNAASLMPVDDIPADLREAIEDVILNRRADATERLVAMAEEVKAARDGVTPETITVAEDSLTASQQIERLLVKGHAEGMDAWLAAAMREQGSAVGVIDGPLMEGLNRIGRLFGEGKMFLPQVVKSARAMKHAVAWLTPHIEREKAAAGGSSAGKMVIATVRGDVHDIGKNIVSVIMNCNGYEMVDMGVMVPGEEIVDKAIAEKADFIGLSGLITPSLDEMCHVARLMEIKGLRIPLLIGGATTSALHTAVKIAPCYGGPVVYTRDAAMMPVVAQRLINPDSKESAIAEIRDEQQRLRERHDRDSRPLLPLEEARHRAMPYGDSGISVPIRPGIETMEISISDARRLINWRAFFAAWKLDASFASLATIEGCDHCRAQWIAAVPEEHRSKAAEAMQLFKEANRALDFLVREVVSDGLKARIAILPAGRRGDDILYRYEDKEYVLPTLRQQTVIDDGCYNLALADFIAPMESDGALRDWIGLFVVTSGRAIERIVGHLKSQGDDYKAILYQSVADRLVEAATELMHRHVRRETWGYETEPVENPGNPLRQYYRGIRPAIGYPSLPDQSLVFLVDKVLDYGSLGVDITGNGAMSPVATTTGYIFAHPDSRYFMVGRIDAGQRADYASRRGMSSAELDKFLPDL
ncbi:MAG: methionine synthase [Pseudoflavonifractor sp.]|nr:methionine synthase [Pseudoflavonifractor sp.]